MAGWTDSHCHLTDAAFADDREEVIGAAAGAGVERIVLIGCAADQFEPVLALASSREGFVAALGFHPDAAGKVGREDTEHLRRLLGGERVRAVGEIGLDYHWEPEKKEQQRRLFEEQLEMAAAAGMPVVIHERDAFEDVMAALHGVSCPVLLHCFSHGRAEARRALDRGYLLALGGAVTFRSAEELRETARYVPEERLLLETDAPYLTPHPDRGRRNEPRYVAVTGHFLAEIRNTTPEALAGATSSNACGFFGPFGVIGPKRE